VKALDTNVLVRYLTADDESMVSRVQKLFDAAEESGEFFLVSLLVLLETLWVLRSTI
jgi:predicted nucleic-acid-binding protein